MSNLVWLIIGVAGAFFSTMALGVWGLLAFAIVYLWMSKSVIENI